MMAEMPGQSERTASATRRTGEHCDVSGVLYDANAPPIMMKIHCAR